MLDAAPWTRQTVRAVKWSVRVLDRILLTNDDGIDAPGLAILEAIAACERLTQKPMNWRYSEQNRTGDHIWWISDVRRFQSDYPGWRYRYDIDATLAEIIDGLTSRLKSVGE